jgi:hypothetical protein
MPLTAQRANKTVAIKKQTGLGVVASGTGGQLIRRESSKNSLKIATFDNNEILSHMQSTGKTHGARSVDIALNGVLSPGTYSQPIASVLRKDFVATTALTGLAIAVAGTLGTYTLTGTGLLVSGGFKIGDVIRITLATGLATDCLNKNLVITAITNTIITCRTVNGSTMTVGSGTACTIALPGKKSMAPITGHTKDYWTVEDWQSDISQSEVFNDVMIGKLDIGLPSGGNSTIAFSGPGLNRTLAAVRSLTTPTAETTSNVMSAVSGMLILNGVAVTALTGITLSIDNGAGAMAATVGSVVSSDIVRGNLVVGGSFTAFYQDSTMSALFEAGTAIGLVAIISDGNGAAAEFVTVNLAAITLDADDKDEGDKGIIRTYAFSAEINGAGGIALATDQTIISIQDSLAV